MDLHINCTYFNGEKFLQSLFWDNFNNRNIDGYQYYSHCLFVCQAAHLTASGNELRRLGQEIAARPFYYSTTPDIELHSFLMFTDATRYQVHSII